jgi:predicted acyl esterase
VSRYVTEGEVRLRDRATESGGPGAERGTGRSYRRADALPYEPGSVVDVVIALQPTSALVRAGHRLRIAIAGADAGTFAPVTKAGTRFTVARGGGAGSTLELPVDGGP